MMFLRFILLVCTTVCFSQTDKIYSKIYYDGEILKSEGWLQNDKRDGYWFFYNKEGELLKEGHYSQGKRTDWWILYGKDNTITKVQYNDDVKDGYALLYKNDKLYKAKKYSGDQLTGTWTSLKKFKRDNYF
ncbi:toxin-antitoxin system YwqK family antitoxin [Dokdonia sp. Hel_I_53]|uniref:toxin-antitoxin system YwqK family antitoxin n=1 Tax=Dokdonia sp. Hel_I_53 TaxID=1566287 RepID=UPI00119B84D8|nr:hypothetical protein [Dokdonia sp. Hel_I_53]TVZ51988.1 hypothetical protein OD90_1150 [Dokdonia sp. Hel_I_53]